MRRAKFFEIWEASVKSEFAAHIYLRQVELFQDLSAREIEALEKMMPVKRMAAGTVFYAPQQSAESLFLIKQGRVRLYHLSPEGKAFTTATVEEGVFFGEMALLGQSLYGSFAEAATPCLLCVMSRRDVQAGLLSDVRIAGRLVEMLGKNLLETQHRLADLALKNVASRVAALLLQLAHSQLAREGRNGAPLVGSVEVACTHEELGQGVGACRETVTKLLNEWRAQELVELQRGRIVLRDVPRLTRLGAD